MFVFFFLWTTILAFQIVPQIVLLVITIQNILVEDCRMYHHGLHFALLDETFVNVTDAAVEFFLIMFLTFLAVTSLTVTAFVKAAAKLFQNLQNPTCHRIFDGISMNT